MIEEYVKYLQWFQGSRNNQIRLQHFIDIVRTKIEQANFSFIIQNDEYFTEAIDHCLSYIEKEEVTKVQLITLLKEVAADHDVYVSEKINGLYEYASAKEAYTERGRQILSNPLNHFMDDDIYFNTDERFLDHQKNILVQKHMQETMAAEAD